MDKSTGQELRLTAQLWRALMVTGAAGIIVFLFFAQSVVMPQASLLVVLGVLALFAAVLHLFPITFLDSEWSLVHALVLGAAVLYGPLAAMGIALTGLAIGAFAGGLLAGRLKKNRQRFGKYQLIRRPIFAHLYEAGRLVVPLGLAVWLADWHTAPTTLPALGFSAAVRFTILYSLLHTALLLPEFALGLRPALRSIQHNVTTLALLEWLAMPFVTAAALAYPSLGVVSLTFLVGVPTLLTLLLNESNTMRSDLERRRQDLTALNEISEMMRYSLDLDTLLGAVQSQVSALMKMDNFYVALFDERKSHLSYPLAVKRGHTQTWPARPLADRLTDRVIKQRRAILLAHDAYKEMADIGVPVGDELIFAWLGVPLATPARTLGCLAVYSYRPGASFTQADQEVLVTLASQVSVALENALLFTEAQNRARQLEALNITSATISASLNLNEVFATITESVSEVSRGQRGAIFLLDDTEQEVVLLHGRGISEAFQKKHHLVRRDSGLARTLETGQPTLQPDIRKAQSQPYLDDLLAEGVHAYADLPLTTPEGQLGYLTVYYDEPQVFENEEIELLSTFALQAALAVGNARQYAQADQALARRAEQLRMLEIIGRQNSAALRSDDLFSLLLEYALEFTRSPWGALVLYNAGREVFEVKAQVGYQMEEDSIDGMQGITGRVARNRTPEIVNNVTVDPDFLDVTGGETASQLTVPIIHKNSLLGLIVLESPVPDEYTQSELSFVVQLADQAALAVQNADLYDQAQRRLHEQATLNMVSTRLAGSQDLNRILDAVVQTMSATLDSHLAGIYLWDEGREVFALQASMTRSEDFPGELPETLAPAALDIPTGARMATGGLNISHEQTGVATALLLCETCRALVFPLNAGSQTLGLVLAHAPANTQPKADDLNLPRLVAAQGALALQNAWLFSDVSQGRDRLEAVLNAVGEGVLMVNAEGRITLANHPAETLTGLSIHALTGSTLAELPAEARAAFGLPDDEIKALLAPPAGRADRPARQPYAHHQRFLERTTAPVWGLHDDPLGWVIVIRDITEEHQLNQARDLITETLVHDLRSPIGTVQTTLQLLQESLDAETGDDFTRKSLGIAERSLARVLTLVNSLLDISRLEAGSMDLRLETAALTPLVEEALAEMAGTARELGITLDNAFPAGLPSIKMDSGLIRRVLTNLLDNALKFTPEGGHIRVFAALAGTGDRVILSVSDSGPGVPPEYRQEIFKRFGQTPGTRGRKRGTGLGLTYCRLAVEAHGGEIWVDSNPDGPGAVFKFALPVSAAR
ncbi:MAG: GAF domain-containing protein [Anaerolineae bacterium]|nr:MAG: GAF domain-containing protein [Anaerolineae bacterium]